MIRYVIFTQDLAEMRPDVRSELVKRIKEIQQIAKTRYLAHVVFRKYADRIYGRDSLVLELSHAEFLIEQSVQAFQTWLEKLLTQHHTQSITHDAYDGTDATATGPRRRF